MLIIEKSDLLIKYVFTFVIFSSFISDKYKYIFLKEKIGIELDNKLEDNLYESDASFIKYQTKIKPIAFYYPEYNNISYFKLFHKNMNFNLLNFVDIEHLIEKQTTIAKNHGIYGFAIYFDLLNINYYHNITINLFSHKSNFPFFLIWENDEIKNKDKQIIEQLIKFIQQHLISDNYIKIKNKPVLSISNPSKILGIKNFISNLRKKAKEKKVGKLFIFYPFKGNFTERKFLTEFDATYDFSRVDLIEHTIVKSNILYYSGIIYKNLILNKLHFNFPLYRSCYINYKNFNDYNPEKFYIANNLIFEWETKNYLPNNGILFVDSWNNYINGKYLEPDENYGFSSLNTFSRALFNLPFHLNNYNFSICHDINIAIQVHVFYEDLLIEIINKLNNIPLKYDIYISTVSEKKKEFIQKCLINSNAKNYEIKIFKNQGRDVLPFIKQMKNVYKRYKYICHIHTKKSNHKSLLGANWRNYIYSNLIGNEIIVSEILFNFEQNKKLGFIFPEIYYDIIKDVYDFDNINFPLNKPNKKYMNYLLNKIFRKFKIGEKLDFPAGNMFWAKTKAIYQIFNVRLRYPKELNQTNETIMHGIERIWLYLVKLNGYYYKIIFKHY